VTAGLAMISECSKWPVVMYLLVSVAVLVWAIAYSTKERDTRLRIPLAINAVASGLLSLAFFDCPQVLDALNPFGTLRGELFIIFVLVGTYVLTLEIPGFLLNRDYDTKICHSLDELQEAVLKARVSGREGISRIGKIVKEQSPRLDGAGILSIARNSAQLFTQLNNFDVSVCDLLLREVVHARSRIEGRSKHALPLLAEVLKLSGLVFLLAEILALLHPK